MTRRLRVMGVGSDVGLAVALQGLGAVASFAQQIVLLRGLPGAEADVYFMVVALVSITGGLADFGIAAAILPKMAVGRGEVTPTYGGALLLRLGALAVGLPMLGLYLLLVGEGELFPLVLLAYVAAIISAKATGLRQLFELPVRLRGRTYAVGAIALLDTLVTLGLLLLLSATGRLTLMTAVVVFGFGSIVGFALLGLPAVRELRSLRLRAPLRSLGRISRTLLVAALPVAMIPFLGQLSGQLETLIIASHSLGEGEIAAYNAAIRPMVALLFVAITFAAGIAPLLSQGMKRERADASMSFVASIGTRILGVTALAMGVVSWCFAPWIMSIFGKGYVDAAYILRLYSIISGMVFLVVLYDQFLLALRRRRETLIGGLLQVSVALALELVALARWGITGLLVAKGVSMTILILYQVSRLPVTMRRAALEGWLRLAPPALMIAGTLWIAAEQPPLLRALLAFGALLVGMVVARALPPNDLRQLRSVQIAAPAIATADDRA